MIPFHRPEGMLRKAHSLFYLGCVFFNSQHYFLACMILPLFDVVHLGAAGLDFSLVPRIFLRQEPFYQRILIGGGQNGVLPDVRLDDLNRFILGYVVRRAGGFPMIGIAAAFIDMLIAVRLPLYIERQSSAAQSAPFENPRKQADFGIAVCFDSSAVGFNSLLNLQPKLLVYNRLVRV